MIQIQAPDGSIVEFPEGTDDATIKSVMARSFPAQQPAPQTAQPQAPVAPQQQDQRWGWQKAADEYLGLGALRNFTLNNSGAQTARDFATGVMKGNIPFADEITAGAMTPFGMAKQAVTGQTVSPSAAYSDALAFNRDTDKQAYERSPIANTVGQVAGALNTAGTFAKGGLTLMNPAKATMGNMALRGAAEGALYNGAYSFGEGEGLEDRLNKGMWGIGTGALTGGLSGSVAGWLANRAAQKTIPSAETIKQQASAAYKFAEDSGVVFRPDAYSQFYDNIFSKSARNGLNQTLTPHSVAALKSLEELKGIPLTLQSLETQRKVLNNAAAQAARAGNKTDAAIANSAIRRLDDFVANNSNVLFSGADPKRATEALKAARAGWRQANASETITEITENLAPLRAQGFSQSGYDNALKTEFTQLLRNKSKMRFFTEAEQQQIRKVVDGSAGEKALRFLGKFAMRGPVSGMYNLMAGVATANPYAPIVTSLIGEAGKAGATAMRSNSAKIVDLLARSGGQLPKGQISQAQKLIIDALVAGQRQIPLQQAPASR